jgi:hypothetical protein
MKASIHSSGSAQSSRNEATGIFVLSGTTTVSDLQQPSGIEGSLTLGGRWMVIAAANLFRGHRRGFHCQELRQGAVV